MKIVSVTMLLICSITLSFSDWLMIGCFKLNQGRIAKEICVERDQVHNHCNGHCYLLRQVNEQEKHEAPWSTGSNERFDVQPYCIASPLKISVPDALLESAVVTPRFFCKQEYHSTTFHPPCIV